MSRTLSRSWLGRLIPGKWSARTLLATAIAGSVLLVAAFGRVVSEVNDFYPDSLPANPYLVLAEAPTFYLLMPLVVLAALIVIWAPGVVAIVQFGRPEGLGPRILKAFVVTFLVHVVLFSLLKIATPEGVAPTAYRSLLLVTAVVAALLCLGPRRRAGSEDLSWLSLGGHLGWLAGGIYAATVLLLPVLFWQDINPDGLEALTTGRSLRHHVLPRLPTGQLPGPDVGMISMAYPVHWFIELFGVIEAAARLPLLLYMPVVLAGIVALAEWKQTRRLSHPELGAVVLILGVFVVTLAFNDTYHMYSADIASPANIDVLAVGCLLGMVYFIWTGELGWFFAYTILAHATRPTGVMVLVLVAVGMSLSARSMLLTRARWLVAALLVCVGWTVFYEQVLPTIIGTGVGGGSGGILDRLYYLTLTDFGRIGFLIIPSGVVPAAALFAWSRSDSLCRCLVIVTVLYFVFFYSLAFTALHHFAPVMIFPVVVFARLLVGGKLGRAWLPVAVIAAFVSLMVSLPRSLAVDRSMREIGRATQYDIGDYDGDYGEYRAAAKQKGLLHALFAPHWKVEDPAAELFGSPWQQIHYASRTEKVPSAVNYWVRPADSPAPDGFTKIAESEAAALYIRDLARWERDRERPPPIDFRSRIYAIPRETLFRRWGVPAENYDLDLRALEKRLRALPSASR